MKRILDDIKNSDIRQVYLLYGTEKHLASLYKDKLLKHIVPDNDMMNYTVFSEKTATEEAIIDQCETVPFFSDRRIILIENSGFFNEKKDKLAAYLAALPPYVVLIFFEDSVDKRGKLCKAANKYERVIEFTPLSENELATWAARVLKQNNKVIRKSTLSFLLSNIGTDMTYISSELEKLISYTGDREEVTVEDVEQVSSFLTENKIFEMISDIANNKKKDALDKYYDLLTLKEPPIRILFLIVRQYTQFLKIKEMLSYTRDERSIAQALGIHPYAVKKNLPLSKSYSYEKLKKILEELAHIEESVKSGLITDKLSIELIIMSDY